MKKLISSMVMLVVALLASLSVSAQSAAPANRTDSVSDAFGTIMGTIISSNVQQAERMGLGALDSERVLAAITTVMRGGQTAFTAEEADAFLESLQRPAAAAPQVLDPESQAAFVADEAKADNAVTTPSGLVFQTLVEGEGEMPVAGQKVLVNYVGRLADGTEFDNTNGTPVTFDLEHLIPGFIEGLKMMRPGGTYRLIIPSNLGYGANGIGGVIPGNASLDFTVELVDVLK